MTNWKCVECGRVHRKNVTKCRNCSHSVLQQTTDAPTSTLSKWLNKLGL